jgi:anaerobic selenocysteine-containing dehydrogenase
LLVDGEIKAALVIGEDPMQHDRYSSYFGGIELMVAMDWAQTETTQFADISLPGTTYLESAGTRFGFDGKASAFSKVVEPPSGKQGWEVLAKLAQALGLNAAKLPAITRELKKLVKEGAGGNLAFYWNDGKPHSWKGKGKLGVAGVRTAPTPIPPPLTECERYKRGIREVGDERFRVL